MGRVVQSWVKITQGNLVRDLNSNLKLKRHFRFNSFFYNLMIGSSKNNRENYLRNPFDHKKEKPGLNLIPG